MKLAYLYEDLENNVKNAIGLRYIKKLADPNRLGALHDKNNNRSGNQDTPMTPRQRRFFNAPLGGMAGKSGYGEVDDEESRHAKDSTVSDKISSLDYPKDKNEVDKEIEKKARKEFGHLAVAGPKPRLKL